MKQLLLPFGSNPDPPKLCPLLEITFDLGDDFFGCEEWYPEEVYYPHQYILKYQKFWPDNI